MRSLRGPGDFSARRLLPLSVSGTERFLYLIPGKEVELEEAFDPGLAAVRFVFESLDLSPERSVRGERGFTWWGPRLAQRVWADEPFDECGRVVSCVHAETDLLRSFPTHENALARFGETARGASLFGLLPRKDGALGFWSSACVCEENLPWMPRVLAAAAALAAREAEESADPMSRALGTVPAASDPPAPGWRAQPGGLSILPRADEPVSRWNDQAEFDAIRDAIMGKAGCFPSVGDRSLRAEIPFGPRGGYEATGGLAARLDVSTRARHPAVGSGVLLRLHLPFCLEYDAQARAALDLNALERTSYLRFHSLGSWCPHPGPGPAYISFVPNGLYERDVLLCLTLSMVARAEWIGRRYETSEELRRRFQG